MFPREAGFERQIIPNWNSEDRLRLLLINAVNF